MTTSHPSAHLKAPEDLRLKIAEFEIPCEQAVENAVQAIGKRYILELTKENGNPQVKLFPDKSGHALAAITKLADGTLEYQGPLEPHYDREREPAIWNQLWSWLIAPLRKQARELITKEVKEAVQAENAPAALREAGLPARRRAITRAVNQAMDRIIADIKLPEGEIPRSSRSRGKTINQTVRRRLIGEKSWQKAVQVLQHSLLNVSKYNRFASNREVFEPMLPKNKSAVQYYVSYLYPEDGSTPKIQHPGEVIKAVKQELGLKPAQWKWFLRLDAYWPGADAQGRRSAIHVTTRAAVELDRPNANRGLLQRLTRRVSHYNERTAALVWDHGDPWRAWVHLARTLIDATGEERYASLLSNVEDALIWHVRNNQPWGLTDWPNYLLRSERWHQAQGNNVTRGVSSPERDLSWETVLGETESNGFILRPLTSSKALSDAGQTLRNCLVNYDIQCAADQSRIFGVYHGDKLLAAGELALDGSGGEWQVRQVSETANRPPRKEIVQALREAARLYRQAARTTLQR